MRTYVSETIYIVSQKRPTFGCNKFDTREQILIFLSQMLPIKQSKDTLLCHLNDLCFCALPGKTEKHGNCIFHSNAVYCIARIQPVAAWFLKSFWFTTHTHAALRLPKSCNQLGAGGVGLTGQLADTPTRGLPTRGLDISRTWQLADAAGSYLYF